MRQKRVGQEQTQKENKVLRRRLHTAREKKKKRQRIRREQRWSEMPHACPRHCANALSRCSKHSSLLCQQRWLLISNVPSAATAAKAPASATSTELSGTSVGTLHRYQWLFAARTCSESRSAGPRGHRADPAPRPGVPGSPAGPPRRRGATAPPAGRSRAGLRSADRSRHSLVLYIWRRNPQKIYMMSCIHHTRTVPFR